MTESVQQNDHIVVGSLIVVDPLLTGEETIKKALIAYGVTADVDQLILSGLKKEKEIQEDIDDSVANTSIDVVVSSEAEGDWSGRSFKYQYRRANIEHYLPSLAAYTAGVYVKDTEPATIETKTKLLKALTTVSGMNENELNFKTVTETEHYGIEDALFSNINKGLVIEAKEDSYVFVGQIYIPLIQTEEDLSEEDPEVKKMFEEAKRIKDEEVKQRTARDEEQKRKRAEELAKLKEQDEAQLNAIKEDPEVLKPSVETGVISPGDWIGEFEDIDLPPPDPTPPPPPTIPEFEDDPTPPEPPPIDTPPPPRETISVRLGGFENSNMTAREHMTHTANVNDKEMNAYLKQFDVDTTKGKVNPDNPYLYTGVSKTTQAMALTSVTDTKNI